MSTFCALRLRSGFGPASFRVTSGPSEYFYKNVYVARNDLVSFFELCDLLLDRSVDDGWPVVKVQNLGPWRVGSSFVGGHVGRAQCHIHGVISSFPVITVFQRRVAATSAAYQYDGPNAEHIHVPQTEEFRPAKGRS